MHYYCHFKNDFNLFLKKVSFDIIAQIWQIKTRLNH